MNDDPTRPPVTLDYASPPPPARRQIPTRSRFIGAARQATFAIGTGLLMFGFGEAVMRIGGAPGMMGLGGFLVGLAWKFRRGNRL